MSVQGTPGVSVCIAVALKFVNTVVGESDESSDFWQHVLRSSVCEYFEHALSQKELQRTVGFKVGIHS